MTDYPKKDHAFYAFALKLLRAQQRLLNRWSEGDDAVRQQLWRDLHASGDELLLTTHSSSECDCGQCLECDARAYREDAARRRASKYKIAMTGGRA